MKRARGTNRGNPARVDRRGGRGSRTRPLLAPAPIVERFARGADDAPPRRPGRCRGLRRRGRPSSCSYAPRNAIAATPKFTEEGCFCLAPSSSAQAQSTRSEGGAAHYRPLGPATSCSGDACDAGRTSSCRRLRSPLPKGCPCRHTGQRRGCPTHPRWTTSSPPRPRQRLTAAAPHARARFRTRAVRA